MKCLKQVCFVLFVLLAASCREPMFTESRLWQNVEPLVGKVLHLDSVYMRYPFRILSSGSGVYILDLHGPDFYCHLFNSQNLHVQQSFAPRGNGPEDFLSAENIRIDAHSNFYLLDANRSEISVWSQNRSDTLTRIKLAKELVRTLDFDIVNDSTFVVPDYTGNHRFVIIDHKGHIVSKQYIIPIREDKKQIANIALAQAWRSFIDYNPENGILAMATQLGEVLELYDLKADTIVNIVYGKNGEPEYIDKGGYAVPNGIMGYSDVYVGAKNIYALFWGRSFKEIRNGHDTTEGGNKLRVFDLKGNPVCEYVLDKFITGFTVDETQNKIMALDINSNQPLVEYQL